MVRRYYTILYGFLGVSSLLLQAADRKQYLSKAKDERITVKNVISGYKNIPDQSKEGSKGRDPYMFPTGYKNDLEDFEKALQKETALRDVTVRLTPTHDIAVRLKNDAYHLRSALGEKSQARMGAVALIEKLTDDPVLFKEFYDLGKKNTLLQLLDRIASYEGTDSIFDDFSILEKEEKKGVETLTSSKFDDSLISAITNLDAAIEEAKTSLQKNKEQEDFNALISSTRIEPSAFSISSMSSVPVVTSSDSLEDVVSKRIKIIASWPHEAKSEKIAALQLLVAYNYDLLTQSQQKGEGKTSKFLESIRLFNALRDLGASIPSVREREDQKYYNIKEIGLVSGRQLQDYADSGKGDLLLGFCRGLHNLEKTVKKYEANPAQFSKYKEMGLMKRYRVSYSICAYLQGKAASEQVKKTLAAHDAWIKRAESKLGTLEKKDEPFAKNVEPLPLEIKVAKVPAESYKQMSNVKSEQTPTNIEFSPVNQKNNEFISKKIDPAENFVGNELIMNQPAQPKPGFVSNLFSGLGKFVGGIVTPVWTPIKAVFTGIGKFFSNIFGRFWR